MPPFGPIHRRELIRGLKKLGFSGPFAGGKHEFMVREADQLRLFRPKSTQRRNQQTIAWRDFT